MVKEEEEEEEEEEDRLDGERMAVQHALAVNASRESWPHAVPHFSRWQIGVRVPSFASRTTSARLAPVVRIAGLLCRRQVCGRRPSPTWLRRVCSL